MGEPTADARKEVEEARRALTAELDQLGSSARAALDIPAKIRRNPIQTAGVAGGAAFLLLGGPRRVARRVEKRFFPRRAARIPTLLPKDLERTIDRLPEEQQERVRGHLERDFATYVQKQHTQDPANARQSIWKTYDLFLGIVGAAAARELVKRLFAVPQGAGVEPTGEPGTALGEFEAIVGDIDSDDSTGDR